MKRVPIIAAVAVVATLTPMAAFTSISAGSAATFASHHARASVTYHGTRGEATRLAHVSSMSKLPAVRQGLTPRQLWHLAAAKTFRASARPDRAARVAQARARKAGTVDRLRGAADAGPVVHNFNGLSDTTVFGFFGQDAPITPPDQGLCVGNDATLPGDPKAVFEPINIAVRETTPDGTLLRPDVDGRTFYQNPFSEGDVRCVYDPSTQTFFFTELGFPVGTGPAADFNNDTDDVVVMNAHGVAMYQFDASQGGNCFADQDKVGFDNNALVISTDQFCDPNEDDFEGALLVVISKSQLVNEDATVSDATVGPLSLAGSPVTALDPAIDTGSGQEYLVNSVPRLADGFTPNPAGDTLGVWTLQNTASVTTGTGTPTAAGTVVPSEQYTFPVPAASTGDGSTFSDPPWTITSEPALDPGDARTSGPVNVTRGPYGIRLWTAIDTAVTPAGASAPQDAAAWFEINPVSPGIVRQGYVTAPNGDSLLYPAIAVCRLGTAAMTFSITGSAVNPSAAYTTIGSHAITIAAAGNAPHESFTDVPPFNTPRWGDYSWAVADPDNGGVWLATEYIPPPAFQAEVDNWGTDVFEVNGP
ncbi:MAG TPA: hypothetical protein VFQ44_00625 [Streptosporangiaceae bacterium]|nr:hypothetical protein [Streptosporangiaceae bacterium]